MFSMFGRTGAPQEGGPHKSTKNISCCNSSMHCSRGPQQNVDDDYCAYRVKAIGGGIYIVGAPAFFYEQGPR